MIDPARVVTANLWIDDVAIFQPEVESVWIVGVVGGRFPWDGLPLVFDDAGAFGNDLRGVNAPTVNTGLANFDLHRSLSTFVFLRDIRCRIAHTRGLTDLFFDRAADFPQMLPKRVTRIASALLQISREVQL